MTLFSLMDYIQTLDGDPQNAWDAYDDQILTVITRQKFDNEELIPLPDQVVAEKLIEPLRTKHGTDKISLFQELVLTTPRSEHGLESLNISIPLGNGHQMYLSVNVSDKVQKRLAKANANVTTEQLLDGLEIEILRNLDFWAKNNALPQKDIHLALDFDWLPGSKTKSNGEHRRSHAVSYEIATRDGQTSTLQGFATLDVQGLGTRDKEFDHKSYQRLIAHELAHIFTPTLCKSGRNDSTDYLTEGFASYVQYKLTGLPTPHKLDLHAEKEEFMNEFFRRNNKEGQSYRIGFHGFLAMEELLGEDAVWSLIKAIENSNPDAEDLHDVVNTHMNSVYRTDMAGFVAHGIDHNQASPELPQTNPSQKLVENFEPSFALGVGTLYNPKQDISVSETVFSGGFNLHSDRIFTARVLIDLRFSHGEIPNSFKLPNGYKGFGGGGLLLFSIPSIERDFRLGGGFYGISQWAPDDAWKPINIKNDSLYTMIHAEFAPWLRAPQLMLELRGATASEVYWKDGLPHSSRNYQGTLSLKVRGQAKDDD